MRFALCTAGILSTIFRAATYIFLRIIPATLGTYILPFLYTTYLISTTCASTPKSSDTPEGDKYKDAKGTSNGSAGNSASEKTQPRTTLWDVLFSYQTTRNARIVTFAINTLLLSAALDLILEPYFDRASDVVFTRVGAVTSDSAQISIRLPMASASNESVQLLWRKVSNSSIIQSTAAWTDGPVLIPSQEFDWTVTARVRGLWPSTEYEYVLAYTNKTRLPYPSEPIQFRTFPDPRIASGSHFRFLATSCVIPNFPWVPLEGRVIKGFDYMAEYLSADQNTLPGLPSVLATVKDDSIAQVDAASAVGLTDNIAAPPPRTEFLMFLGDFIYADVPWYFGNLKEEYRRLYRRVYNSPSFRRVYERLPILHTYDDHEIINNYEGKSNDTEPFANAADSFKIYQGDANHTPLEKEQYYYEFRYGDVAYFVMDTRRYRSGMSENPATRTMLGDKQLTSLYNWLINVNNTATFKFLVSSVPFTSLWTGDAQQDSWAGYSSEKDALLDVMHTIPNIFLISGDRHEFAAIEFNSAAPSGHTIFEISTSPLNQFYIPLIRTLRQHSDERAKRILRFPSPDSSGNEPQFNEVEVDIPRERTIKYIAVGNHKWSAFEVDTTNATNPLLHLDVIIDGHPAYRHTFVGTPVKLKSSSSAISAVTHNLKSLFGRVGISPSKWF